MLALGEVLLRLSPEGNERLTQGTRFEKQLGGAELNVAVGAANLRAYYRCYFQDSVSRHWKLCEKGD
ncbi:MAG: hypothetical protein ACLS61_15490 [Ruminococcus sp.]